MTTVIRKYREK